MSRFLFLLALGALCGASEAQNARTPVQVNSGTPGGGSDVGVASDGDLSAIVYSSDGVGNTIYCAVSDGRGLTWSQPVRVDSDAGPIASLKGVDKDSVGVGGDNVYVVWEDQRDCGFVNLFFARSTDRGLSFGSDVRLDATPSGCQPDGNRDVIEWDTAFSGNYVYVAMLVDNGAVDDLYLMASSNGGASFGPAIPVSTQTGVGSVEAVELACEGANAYITWIDTRPGPQFADVYFRRILSGGAGLGSELKLNSSVSIDGDADGDLEVEVSGSVVVVAFHENGLTPITFDANHVAVSTDGGATFSNDVQVGQGDPNLVDADDLEVAISKGNIVLVWDDNRSGLGDDIITAYSSDGGATWSPDLALTTGGTGQRADIAFDSGIVGIRWENDQPSKDTVLAAHTRDGGVTWTAPLTVSDNPGDTDRPAFAHNALYGNFVFAWPADDSLPLGYQNDFFAGGYRPQTLTPTGWVAGPTAANFVLSGFSGDEAFALVFASATPGSFPLGIVGDPRNLGLTLDSLFLLFLNTPTLSLATLNGAGSGGTTVLPFSAPVGLSLYVAAVSLDLSGASPAAEITDVEQIVVGP